MADSPMLFLPLTLVDWSTIAANGAVIVGGIYAGFSAIPGLAKALKTIARRDVSNVAERQAQEVRGDAADPSGVDAPKELRVSAFFALFDEWKRPPAALSAPHDEAVARILAFLERMLVDLPTYRADHWRQVILGELVKHTAAFRRLFGSVTAANLAQ